MEKFKRKAGKKKSNKNRGTTSFEERRRADLQLFVRKEFHEII